MESKDNLVEKLLSSDSLQAKIGNHKNHPSYGLHDSSSTALVFSNTAQDGFVIAVTVCSIVLKVIGLHWYDTCKKCSVYDKHVLVEFNVWPGLRVVTCRVLLAFSVYVHTQFKENIKLDLTEKLGASQFGVYR